MASTMTNLRAWRDSKDFFDAFRKKAEHNLKSEDDSDEEPQTYPTYENILLNPPFLTIPWFTTPMVYILIKHKYRKNQLVGSE